MAESKLLVKTTLGTSILDLETRVNVHVKENMYLTKEAIDLNPGDLVIFAKEYIETTLDKVEEYLDLSPRYMHAKKQVTEQNLKGEFIPLLRTELWRGILKKHNKYNESLESIIKKDTDDFQKDEYAEAMNDICTLLNNRGIEKSESAIRNWLKGEIFSPHEWKIFTVLSGINPIFKEFDETNKSYDGKHYNYKFFVTARQVIMRYLAKLRGEEFKLKQEGAEEKDNSYKIRLDKEIDIVVRNLMQDKGKNYALTRVIETQRLRHKDPSVREIRRNPEHRLSKGIVSHVSGIEIKSKNAQEFFKEFIVTNDLFSYMLDKYIALKHVEEGEKFLARDEEGNLTGGYKDQVKQFILNKYNEPLTYKSNYEYEGLKRYFNEDDLSELEKLADAIINETFDGTIDDIFSLPKGSCKKLLETNYKVKMLRPKRLIEYDKISDEHNYNIKVMDDIIKKPYKTEEDMAFLNRFYHECEPIHDKILKLQKIIAEKFPVFFEEHYHGIMHVRLNNIKDNPNENDIERTIATYDLDEFREILKIRYTNPQKNNF